MRVFLDNRATLSGSVLFVRMLYRQSYTDFHNYVIYLIFHIFSITYITYMHLFDNKGPTGL